MPFGNSKGFVALNPALKGPNMNSRGVAKRSADTPGDARGGG